MSTELSTIKEECLFHTTNSEFLELSKAANEATQNEHRMSTAQALRKHWKGIGWAFFLSLTIILTGFDITVCANLIAIPAFQQNYGYAYDSVNEPGVYMIPVPWQVGITLGIVGAQIVGAILGGPVADRFGRKLPIFLCVVGNTAFVFLEVFPTSLEMIFAGAFLNGVCYGFYVVLAPMYAAEVVPYHLRNVTIAFTNLSFIAGQLLGQGVTAATEGRTDSLAYRIPFACQWLWSIIIFAGLWFCPESPWYLVHQGRFAEAEQALVKLAVSTSPDDLPNIVAMMEKTSRLEAEHLKSTSYVECFKGTDLRRTEISTMPFVMQIMSCNIFLGFVTYFLSLGDLSSAQAFYIGVGTYALGFLTNLVYLPMMTAIGRRPTYVWGSLTIAILLFTIGLLDLAPDYDTNASFSWAQSILLMITFGVYNLTTGPSSWVIMSETASTRLRPRTVSIAVAVQVVAAVVIVVGIPYQMNPAGANWRGKNGFFYGSFAFIGFVWSYFRLPELKGRTYEEADILFQKRLPTKAFASYKLELPVVCETMPGEVNKTV